jgi:hypothetical protein
MFIQRPKPFTRIPITLARVLEYRQLEPRRIDLLRTHAGILKRQSVPDRPEIVGKISFPFAETIKPLFEAGTDVSLKHSAQFGNYWHSIRDEEQFQKIQNWILEQGTRVFLRNAMDLSIALDMNLVDNQSGQYTHTGWLERCAKQSNDQNAIQALSVACTEAVRAMPFFKNAPVLAAVPDMSGKSFDLPSALAETVAKNLGKEDVTPSFTFSTRKAVPLKEAQVEQKWQVLDATGLHLATKLPDADVVLIDDKYQSGTTMQFVAMKLQEAGARYVFGISLVKTLRDTDNAS